ncbi:hypothetical protein O6H91_02G051000 [Diphasiastrum complanatum]|uniref:Uncharacterized protein n=1 Tax=Diphasiastrum complanatum TaxID=34168 RepID=A0ACC2EFD0_DIPCM|nr:hypothetical protein O6H91_02G051000 [Diphasiastrum complanatum]
MMQFPSLIPPTLQDPAEWPLLLHNDEAMLAHEEAELEEKWNEIRTANEGIIPIGKTTVENDQEEYDQDAEDEDADNVEEESEGEEFEQETV